MTTKERAICLQPLLDEMSDSRYELREKLGEGGQGRVYLATDRTNQTTVVIKHFCTADTLAFSDHERTWRNEFKNSKRVLHFQQRGNSTAGIAQVYELFEVDEHAVLIREYIDGVTLESQISDQGASGVGGDGTRGSAEAPVALVGQRHAAHVRGEAIGRVHYVLCLLAA